ncbi:MAG: transglutaminase domain-containing protein [Bacteroidota bacterium]
MKKISKLYTLLLLILIAGYTHAQDFAKVDATVKNYPATFSDSDKFANKVKADFTREDEKARAIFTWIATNVKYDLAAYGVNEKPVAYSYKTEQEKLEKQKKFKEDLAAKTLKTKKGVCEGYATLFMIVAQKAGLEAVFIPGTSKSHPMHIGKAPGASDHAWNAVKIDGKWKLLDCTWGAGVVTGEKPAFTFKFNDGYFFAEPDVFFLNHYPDDKQWLLTNKTETDFANLPLYYGNYLADGYEVITPVSGIYTNKPGGIISFKINNLKVGDKVHYAFSQEKKYNAITPKTDADTASFDVPLTAKSVGTLTIYVNQKSVVAYKINR